MPRIPKLTVQELQRRSVDAQRQKAGGDAAYREDMKRRAAMRKTKGNFTNHPKKSS